jgi:4'-phosphopantetheinyl transferase EntD
MSSIEPFHPLPSGVMSAVVDLHQLANSVREQELQDLYPYLPKAAYSRRLEHHAGRICAAQAISKLFPSRVTGDDRLPVGRAGEPIWPIGIVGSITHTHDFASAVAASAGAFAGIGIDSERCVDEAVCADIAAVCLSSAEREHFLQGSLSARCWAATAIFSTKEAFYKAAYPHVRRFIEFEELEITHLDLDSGLVIALTQIFGENSQQRIYSRVVARDDHIHACVALNRAEYREATTQPPRVQRPQQVGKTLGLPTASVRFE